MLLHVTCFCQGQGAGLVQEGAGITRPACVAWPPTPTPGPQGSATALASLAQAEKGGGSGAGLIQVYLCAAG